MEQLCCKDKWYDKVISKNALEMGEKLMHPKGAHI